MADEEKLAEAVKPKKRFGRLEAMILIPNLILLGVVLLYLGATSSKDDDVAPAVEDPKTKAAILRLENALLRDPADMSKALKLARLYREAGEFPWSYNALLNAERQGKYREPKWQLRLGLAYLEIGKNDDAVRVLEAAHKGCGAKKCAPPVQVKLKIFRDVARIFVKRKINAARNPRAAHHALRQVLKPISVDPEKMRSKGPLQPEKGEAPEKAEPNKGETKKGETKKAPPAKTRPTPTKS